MVPFMEWSVLTLSIMSPEGIVLMWTATSVRGVLPDSLKMLDAGVLPFKSGLSLHCILHLTMSPHLVQSLRHTPISSRENILDKSQKC